MDYIYWLSQIQYSEQSLVGDKLFILSQLLQNRCPIFPGFVLGNNLLGFLSGLDEPLIKNYPQLDVNNDRALQLTARHSRQAIEDAVFPQAWQTEIFSAARELNSPCLCLEPFMTTPGVSDRVSSLWRSHTCRTNPQAIVEAIKLVWSELFTANSLFYWQKLGLSVDRVGLAILVRPLINVYASGTVKIDRDSMKIQATWGLETSLLQGDVEPDRYDLDRHTGNVRAQYLGLKNYAYRPITDLTTSSTDCLEAYIPDEALAQTYVLDKDAIALLFELIQSVVEQQPQVKQIDWTAIKNTSQPQFYLTRFSNYSTTATTAKKPAIPTSIPTLLSGVPVSPGNLQAEVVVVDTHYDSIPQGAILVTKAIAPQHLALIKRAGGIITETGGKTSHGAIIARELRIPAIVNVPDATKVLQTGDRVLLDGDSGKVYPATTQLELPELKSDRQPPAYPIATKLMVNLSQPESIPLASNLRVDGVGLLRSELMLADLLNNRDRAWWQESFQQQFVATLTDSLRQFTTAFAPRPVFYRSLDRYAEINSVLGVRGTYDYINDPTLFDLELQALAIITAGHHNLNLILPFVRSVEEFKFCYRRIENAGLTTRSSFQVWIMAEVPATIFLLPEYIRAGVGGIAIGTNDLTQLLLGVDREQAQFSDRGLNANHPAMHEAMTNLIKTANEGGIECSICGQAPVEYPGLIEKLIEWGITTISVEPDAVNQTYKAIARAERRILLKSPPKQ